MSDDITQRLRDHATHVKDWEDGETGEPVLFGDDLREAADEIDRLRAENRRMELALLEIANGPMFGPAVIAHVALSGEPDT